MPLSDFPETSAAQLAQIAFPLTDDQIHGAIDGGIGAITDPNSSAYWAVDKNIPLLEATAGISLATIVAGLQAGRDCRNPSNVRSIKYSTPFPLVSLGLVSMDVVLAESVLTISLVALRNALYTAHF
jgi:hypothetical protein